jgi:hypothetical protein
MFSHADFIFSNETLIQLLNLIEIGCHFVLNLKNKIGLAPTFFEAFS